MFAGVWFACRIGVEKKPSAPHSRLAFIHLHASYDELSVALERVTARLETVKWKSDRAVEKVSARSASPLAGRISSFGVPLLSRGASHSSAASSSARDTRGS
jgi:hypothetical protein